MGKAIYQPSGKAAEYAKWACNLYKGCSGMCTYCYNKRGITGRVLGGNTPVLKDCFKDKRDVLETFKKELKKNKEGLKRDGLFFSFISDFLPETKELLIEVIEICLLFNVPVILLTKQVDWITDSLIEYWKDCEVDFGFTLTGHDELELGCSRNCRRIATMMFIKEYGYKTWASIEPIIDFQSSLDMIVKTKGFCDHYKIGLDSGMKYDKKELELFFQEVSNMKLDVYWKESFLKQLK